MTINRHVLLPRSSRQGSKPTVDSIAYGELTVNYNANHEFLATKNSDGNIVTFSSDNSQDGLWKKGTGESAVKLDSGATASGKLSVAEGKGTSAQGENSHAEGLGTITTNIAEHASGKYNQSNPDQIYSIGVGTDNDHRRNAIMVMQNGDTSISGGTLNVSGDTHFHGPYNYLSGTTIIENLSATSGTFDTALSETSVNAVQNSAITKVIFENEKVTAASLNDLNDRKLDASAYTPTDLSDYYKKEETSGKTDLNTAFGLKANASDLTTHISDNIKHITSDERTKWNNATTTLATHTGNSTVHITSDERTKWNGKISNVQYNKTDKKIYFYSGATTETPVSNIDATDFIKDGMVSNVEIKDVTNSGSCLVITFNTDANKQDINIPVSTIFNPANYYLKSETSGKTEIATALNSKANTSDLIKYYKKEETSGKTELDTAFGLKANTTDLTTHTGDSTIHITSAERTKWNDAATSSHTHANKSVLDTITGIDKELSETSNNLVVNSAITKVIEDNEKITSASLNDLNDRKLDYSGITTDSAMTYTASSASGAKLSHTKRTVLNDNADLESKDSNSNGKLKVIKTDDFGHVIDSRDATAADIEGLGVASKGLKITYGSVQTLTNIDSGNWTRDNERTYDGKTVMSISIPQKITDLEGGTELAYVHLSGDTMTGNLKLGVKDASSTNITENIILEHDSGKITAKSFYQSSDKRLKCNIKDISDEEIEKAKAIKLKSFNFKSNNDFHYGIIAQDLEEKGLNNIVTEKEDGYKSVDYISLLVLKVAALEKEIKDLKDKLNK